ncbi:ABC transporter substrate-binding protein [Georgenia sp. Z1491]|uniref:ABC transporter substrate-binding protein n=1 Tax=Georgenia sp. Z1491 TaxID=3416707 RepID=UPI003CF7AE3E
MRKPTVVTSILLSVAVLAACGSGDEDPTVDDGTDVGTATDGAGSAELTELTVGVIPVVDVAPLYLGVQEGIFEEHGLELNLQTSGQGAAAIVPGVVSGEFDIGFGNAAALITAHSQGFDLPVIAPGSSSTGIDGEDYVGVFVSAESDIGEVADLAGRSVAVNTLNSFQDAGVREAVDMSGGDGSSVEFVEVPFPEMLAALEEGHVDAIAQNEPFLTMTQEAGAQLVSSYLVDIAPDTPFLVAPYFTSAELRESDPATVEAFAAAVRESAAFATENQDAVREVLGTYTEISPEIAEAVILPQYLEEVAPAQMEFLIAFTERQGLVEEPVEIASLLPGE